jgi:hypothetical protein
VVAEAQSQRECTSTHFCYLLYPSTHFFPFNLVIHTKVDEPAIPQVTVQSEVQRSCAGKVVGVGSACPHSKECWHWGTNLRPAMPGLPTDGRGGRAQ